MYDQKEIIVYDDSEVEISGIDKDQMLNVLTWGADWTIGTIFNQIVQKKINLTPRMQRRDVWKDDKKSRLIESIILNVPIPQIILAEDKNQRGTYMVIDGKQRLLSIARFLLPTLNKEDREQLNYLNNFSLTDLSILKEFNGMKADELPSEELDALLNQTIRTIVIKNWESEKVLFTIFNRLNTGTVQLSPQELRMSLYPGDFIYYVNDNSLTPQIKRMLRLDEPDSRMNDVEMIIRALSFRLFYKNYANDFQEFLNFTVKTLNNDWKYDSQNIIEEINQLMNDIDLLYGVFEQDAFHNFNAQERVYINRFNKTSYDLLCYFIYFKDVRDLIRKKPKEFKTAYEECFEDPKFSDEFKYRTTEKSRVQYRFNYFKKVLEEKFSVKLSVNNYE
jgi:Protein of unknown function DUF262.